MLALHLSEAESWYCDRKEDMTDDGELVAISIPCAICHMSAQVVHDHIK